MILRFSVHLPFKVYFPQLDNLTILSFEHEGDKIIVYPLQQFSHATATTLEPKIPPLADNLLVGHRVIVSSPIPGLDLLKLDIQRSHFDRPNQSMNYEVLDTGFSIVNVFIERLRNVIALHNIRLLDKNRVLCAFQYLNDDESPLAGDGVHYNEQVLSPKPDVYFANCTAAAWETLKGPVNHLPGYEMFMLEARALSPEPAAVILAFSALEQAVKFVIRENAKEKLNPDMVEFIIGKILAKRGRVDELIKGELAALTGRKLQQEEPTWADFKAIVDARNKVIHEGADPGPGILFKREEVNRLIVKAENFIRLLESLLPARPLPGKPAVCPMPPSMKVSPGPNGGVEFAVY